MIEDFFSWYATEDFFSRYRIEDFFFRHAMLPFVGPQSAPVGCGLKFPRPRYDRAWVVCLGSAHLSNPFHPCLHEYPGSGDKHEIRCHQNVYVHERHHCLSGDQIQHWIFQIRHCRRSFQVHQVKAKNGSRAATALTRNRSTEDQNSCHFGGQRRSILDLDQGRQSSSTSGEVLLRLSPVSLLIGLWEWVVIVRQLQYLSRHRWRGFPPQPKGIGPP